MYFSFSSSVDLSNSIVEYQKKCHVLYKKFQKADSQLAYSFVQLPFEVSSVLCHVEKIKAFAGVYDGIVVVGIGGSNGAARAIENLLCGLSNQVKKISVWWADTVDAYALGEMIAELEDAVASQKRIFLFIVSKSGSTFETVANAEILIALFATFYKKDYARHIIIASDKGSALAHKAADIGAFYLEMPPQIGGRFSAFAVHHLAILVLVGVDIQSLCQGAQDITPLLLQQTEHNNALISAAILFEQYQQGYMIHDFFVPGLLWNQFGNWVRQLVGESLGKKYHVDGSLAHIGFTPTISVCSTDLHSVGQLYVEGSDNRITTFFHLKAAHAVDMRISAKYAGLMSMAIRSVISVYKDINRPFFVCNIPEKNAYYIGQLMQFFLLQTVFLAHLFEVDPFDQPGVQLFKDSFSL